jgi:DNA uptake protein ComE-like DNA-binding protein
MVLPPLTPEQRGEALKKAAEARKKRADVKAKLKESAVSVSEVIALAAKDEVVGKIKVSSLLEALPGVGKVKAQSIMSEIGISDSRRIRGLGPHQRNQLIERFG